MLRPARLIAGARRSASPTASPGGTIERMKSDWRTNSASVDTGTAPARSARVALAALRPASCVMTVAPRSCRRRATAEPISPIAMTPTVSTIANILVSARLFCLTHSRARPTPSLRGSMAFSPGNPAVDRYVAEGYETVRGMSSAFAATICGHIIRRQTELGIKGHIAEIGTFEGRFFIAMALGLAERERALGIDTFNWPNEGLLDLFHAHCARLGLARERYIAIKGNVRDLSANDIRKALGGQELATQASEEKVRFWHVD